MKIHLAADHAGFELKEKLKTFLVEQGHEVTDHGAFEFNKEDDYPDFIWPAVEAVSKDPDSRAIVFGGSGMGEASIGALAGMVAVLDDNEHPEEKARTWREHNDSRILAIGARSITEETAKIGIEIWLQTPFSGEPRHIRRLQKIDDIRRHLQLPPTP